MKQHHYNLPLKILAICLIMLTGLTTIGGTAAVAFGIYDEAFDSKSASFADGGICYELEQLYINRYIYQLLYYENHQMSANYYYLKYTDVLSIENSNFRYVIIGSDGSNAGNTTVDEITQLPYNVNNGFYNYYVGYDYSSDLSQYTNAHEVVYTLYYGVDTAYNADDIFATSNNIYNFVYSNGFVLFAVTLCSLLLTIFLLIYLSCSVGHRAGSEVITRNMVDKLPYDIYLAAVICCGFALSAIIAEFLENEITVIAVYPISFALYALLMGGLLLALWLTTATRIKTHTLFKNTVIWFVLHGLWRFVKFIGRNIGRFFSQLPVTWLAVGGYIVFVILFFLSSILIYQGEGFFLLVAFGLGVLGLALVSIIAHQYSMIKKGITNIANGNLSYNIPLGDMYFGFRTSASKLNSVGNGLQIALNEQMKSEHMKSELITNVSHDIKTPLTSIINYVDLLKKETIDNEKAIEYIDVLDRQSARLKKLTEDVLVASKAASGNIVPEPAPTDVIELLNQCIAEYSDRFLTKNLQPVINFFGESAIIFADGKLLWRIFDNILSNAYKYAQEDTRIYFFVEDEQNTVNISVKNVSKEILNISPDVLMERFVRGDSSRTTEGSGLGLSIAKSLTELQNGTLKLVIDGDLFKVNLTFPKVK